MNYESEIQDLFIEMLKKQYGIEDDAVLYHYLNLRLCISECGKKARKENGLRVLMMFVLSELNLPMEDFQYKGEWMKVGYGTENSLRNVMESWMFENSIRFVSDGTGNAVSVDQYIEKERAKLCRYATNKAKAYKQSKDYEWQWKYFALKNLNTAYNLFPIPAKRIDDICYPEHHAIWKRTLEEECDAFVHASGFQRQDTKTITEQDVEDYLYRRLHLIEDGLTYVSRQVVIPDGRIDILARDKDGIYVIVELKVQEDKELIWQSMYYPMKIKEMYNVSCVRMITVTPSYSNSLLLPLTQLGYVEMCTFSVKVHMGKIEDMYVYGLLQQAS